MGSSAGRNAWVSAALLCVAMLILPVVGWVLFPAPSPPPRVRSSPSAAAPEATLADVTPSSSPRTESRPRPPAAPVVPAASSAEARASVSGFVLDPDGRPVGGAIVACDDPERSQSATSDDEGRFELPPEAAGCEAVARHPGFFTSARSRLSGGSRNTLRLTSGGAIAGTVVDARGAPVTSYLIAVESFQPSSDDGSPSPLGRPRSIADPSGDFLLDKLAAGRYVLTASASGMPPTRSAPVDVEAGSTARGVRITLARGATLSGAILDADTRRPIAGATVGLDAATSTGANAIGGSTSDKDGVYSLEGVPPGPFSVRVAAEGYRSKIVSGLTTHGAPSIREDILLKPRSEGGGDSELIGIGAVLLPSPRGVLIATLIPDGPADRAGVQRGDRIVRIDGIDASSLTVPDCVQRLRGPEGTRVSLTLARDGSSDLEVTVVRATIVR